MSPLLATALFADASAGPTLGDFSSFGLWGLAAYVFGTYIKQLHPAEHKSNEEIQKHDQEMIKWLKSENKRLKTELTRKEEGVLKKLNGIELLLDERLPSIASSATKH